MNDPLASLSLKFAARIIRLFDDIHNRANIKNQLLRASSSVGANIHEAKYGYSKDDFIFKLQLALKESNECVYWIRLLRESETINEETEQELLQMCTKLRYMLVKSVNTARLNQERG